MICSSFTVDFFTRFAGLRELEGSASESDSDLDARTSFGLDNRVLGTVASFSTLDEALVEIMRELLRKDVTCVAIVLHVRNARSWSCRGLEQGGFS